MIHMTHKARVRLPTAPLSRPHERLLRAQKVSHIYRRRMCYSVYMQYNCVYYCDTLCLLLYERLLRAQKVSHVYTHTAYNNRHNYTPYTQYTAHTHYNTYAYYSILLLLHIHPTYSYAPMLVWAHLLLRLTQQFKRGVTAAGEEVCITIIDTTTLYIHTNNAYTYDAGGI
jgi:hypothetical protein